MNRAQRQEMKDEFSNFKPPENFGGGCKKSKAQPGYCALMTWEGILSKIQQGCPNFELCKGQKFTFKP